MSEPMTDNDAAPVNTTEPAPAEKAPAPAPTAEADSGAESTRPRRKVREGIVVSSKMDKTAVVEVVRRSRHPQYGKTVQQHKKYHTHDEENTLNEGDRVRIVETKPLSKNKRWRLLEIVERAR